MVGMLVDFWKLRVNADALAAKDTITVMDCTSQRSQGGINHRKSVLGLEHSSGGELDGAAADTNPGFVAS